MRTRQAFRKICGVKTCANCHRSEDDVEEYGQKKGYPQKFLARSVAKFYPFHEIKKGEKYYMDQIVAESTKKRLGLLPDTDFIQREYETQMDFDLCDVCYNLMCYQLSGGYKEFEFRRFFRIK